jgi:hypothetical protein
MEPLSSELRQILAETFSAGEAQAAEAELLRYGVETHEREAGRVRRGILKLSAGDLTKLQDLVALAKRDYRDLLVSAEYTRGSLDKEKA